MFRKYKAATDCTPFLVMTGHINVMLVSQSCTDSLQVLPFSSSETFPTPSDGTCNVSNTAVQQDVVVVEERSISVNRRLRASNKRRFLKIYLFLI